MTKKILGLDHCCSGHQNIWPGMLVIYFHTNMPIHKLLFSGSWKCSVVGEVLFSQKGRIVCKVPTSSVIHLEG